jgi:hypothetical protein
MKRSVLIAALAAMALLASLRGARAETFVLRNGGRLEGELVNPDERPRKTYVIKLSSGGQVTFQVGQVEKVVSTRPEMAEYEKIRSDYPDTVEGQWNLAEWCKEHRLDSLRKTHLRRVLELDPENTQARRLLGYNKHNDGKWYTEEEWMIKQGYVRSPSGQWKLPQEIELEESKRKKELAEKEWIAKIKQWREWLSGNRSSQAKENLRAIRDPAACRALAKNLVKESNSDVRTLYVDVLSKIPGPEAEATLAYTAMEDSVEEIRLTCLDILQKSRSQETIAYFVHRLGDKDNAMVNRAGVALGRMKDPSTIRPLIDALITTHKEIVHSGGNPGSTSSTFGTRGTPGGGMSFGQKTVVVLHHIQNQDVLNALTGITRQNFSFDQRAWKTWYAAQTKAPDVDVRRN